MGLRANLAPLQSSRLTHKHGRDKYPEHRKTLVESTDWRDRKLTHMNLEKPGKCTGLNGRPGRLIGFQSKIFPADPVLN